MWTVGLTGGIASGKSTVADLFGKLGVEIIDTDIIARSVVEPGSDALAAIRTEFGDWAIGPDGGLDRPAMRRHIFEDRDARARLEGILHPRIEAEAFRRVAACAGPYAMLVVPLLVESGWEDRVDRVLVVDAPERAQLDRLMARDGIDAAQAEAILRSQASREQRLAVADDIIVNDGPPDALERQVAERHRHYLELAANPAKGMQESDPARE